MNLFESTGKLKNGDIIREGDIVKACCGPYVTFTKVIDIDGVLTIYGPGPWQFHVSIYHFENQGNEVCKVSPVDVYKFCKTHNWNSSKELLKFKK